ncbi:MAG TPA: hypothetical protein VH721_05525 [Gaiellaceae bacterium]
MEQLAGGPTEQDLRRTAVTVRAESQQRSGRSLDLAQQGVCDEAVDESPRRTRAQNRDRFVHGGRRLVTKRVRSVRRLDVRLNRICKVDDGDRGDGRTRICEPSTLAARFEARLRPVHADHEASEDGRNGRFACFY